MNIGRVRYILKRIYYLELQNIAEILESNVIAAMLQSSYNVLMLII